MTIKKIILTAMTAATATLCLAGTSASAYTACNSEGDCWHTDSRVTFPGLTLSFHDDKWWDSNRSDSRYHWHDADKDHDWHHGYWAHGEWHNG